MIEKLIKETIEACRPELSEYENLYRHFHANPELSNQERETAATIVSELRKISADLSVRRNIGGHGIAAILENGPGPTVLSRADMDALPVEERTGLAYASTKRAVRLDGTEGGVMHACGHDMHMACLLAFTDLMVRARKRWRGTLIALFQPAEERGTGAQAMVDDGLYDKTKHGVPQPDVVFSGHVVPARSGVLGTRAGTFANSAKNLRVTFHGRGGHASMPDKVINPITAANSALLRLSALDQRVRAGGSTVTCSGFHAGGPAENVIEDDATIILDLRASRVEAELSLPGDVVDSLKLGEQPVKEPTIVETRNFPVTFNDKDVFASVDKAFAAHFQSYDRDFPKLNFSEDFSVLASAIGKPSLLFAYGCTNPAEYDAAAERDDIPTNHSANFAPCIEPTLQVGVDAYAASALAFLHLPTIQSSVI